MPPDTRQLFTPPPEATDEFLAVMEAEGVMECVRREPRDRALWRFVDEDGVRRALRDLGRPT